MDKTLYVICVFWTWRLEGGFLLHAPDEAISYALLRWCAAERLASQSKSGGRLESSTIHGIPSQKTLRGNRVVCQALLSPEYLGRGFNAPRDWMRIVGLC
jgi:hypothetical protein